MTKISNKKKQFIKRNFKQLSIEDLSRQTGLRPKIVSALINEFSTETLKEDLSSATYMTTSPISPKKQSFYVIGTGAILIFIIIFMLYTPALKNEFINWDDDQYVYLNNNIHSLNSQSLYWMFTSYYSCNWHPLTWFSHAIDHAFWGLNPLGHHLTNIVLHGLNALTIFLIVVWILLRSIETNRITLSSKQGFSVFTQSLIASGITALLFGVHPLHVESVVWVAERKDLLCALFFLLTIFFYVFYTASTSKTHRWLYYSICLLLFAFSLMSKPMAVTLPIIILLLDFYPLNRLGKHSSRKSSVLLEKIPFFVFSTISAIITIKAQYACGSISTLESLPMNMRLLNALYSLVFYLKQMILPIELVPFYPFGKQIHVFNPQYIISGILVLAITGGCLWLVKQKKYFFIFVWSYYLITLLPVLGIMQVGKQAAADRYTYLPSISIFLLVGIGSLLILKRCVQSGRKGTLKGLVATFICCFMLLSYLTFKQIKIWHDSEVLWSYVINMFPKQVPSAYNNLSWIYATSPDKLSRNGEKAVALATQACELTNFKKANHLDTLAAAYAEVGDFKLAIKHQQRAIELARDETKSGLLKRLELYQTGQPYRSQY